MPLSRSAKTVMPRRLRAARPSLGTGASSLLRLTAGGQRLPSTAALTCWASRAADALMPVTGPLAFQAGSGA